MISRQFLFGMRKQGCQLARHRQSQQRHHAVGVDFKQALHQTSGLARRHAVVAQQQAAKSIGMDAEIRIGAAGAT